MVRGSWSLASGKGGRGGRGTLDATDNRADLDVAANVATVDALAPGDPRFKSGRPDCSEPRFGVGFVVLERI
jgi:hypothetical protein